MVDLMRLLVIGTLKLTEHVLGLIPKNFMGGREVRNDNLLRAVSM
jgi:hypothetical protein